MDEVRSQPTIKLGLMGFGQIGRMIYQLAQHQPDIEITAIADIGEPHILCYLLPAELNDPASFRLEGNYLVSPRYRSRMLRTDSPGEVPWDTFGVDLVIEATGQFRDRASLEAHLHAGSPRVLARTLPTELIDRIIVPGINESSINPYDRIISAGSATFGAAALLLQAVTEVAPVDSVSITSIHSYSSDQPVQDYAGSDYRRSRSAAENIIPNTHEAGNWLPNLLPHLEGRVTTSALNVPIQRGSLLDVSLAFSDDSITVDAVNDAIRSASRSRPELIQVTEDPIVSSDVIGQSCTVLFDAPGTIKAGSRMIKLLGWYENLGHAVRLLDVARLYTEMEAAGA
ncbi:MAG: glyceraldehyde 3-phosphate dehydrogenase NAD-binding domain-containing protein [Pseudomonadota bacterium]|nr:glyceraldehyde 3-phosphate dehydrogenase NAD-binding domain-containing protein [Pseudomonadota bacterium]